MTNQIVNIRTVLNQIALPHTEAEMSSEALAAEIAVAKSMMELNIGKNDLDALAAVEQSVQELAAGILLYTRAPIQGSFGPSMRSHCTGHLV